MKNTTPCETDGQPREAGDAGECRPHDHATGYPVGQTELKGSLARVAMSRAIREGAGMMLTADRLMNLFDHDEDLERVFATAAARAAQSKVLRLEREWRQWLLEDTASPGARTVKK